MELGWLDRFLLGAEGVRVAQAAEQRRRERARRAIAEERMAAAQDRSLDAQVAVVLRLAADARTEAEAALASTRPPSLVDEQERRGKPNE